jgi:RND family efflux transporter MFP subunit
VAAVCVALFAAVLAALPGCAESPAESKKEMKLPAVTVSYPLRGEVVDYEEFTGRVDAVNKVGVQAMVTGYLQNIKFKDGADVKEDDVLFEIDPRVFAATVNKSKAALELAQAHAERLEEDYNRNLRLAAEKVVSKEDFTRIRGDYLEAKASIGMAQAQLDQDQVNLNYTNVISPITGRLSRRLIDKGNMVKANETMLTWVYQIDPMYGYFDVDERTVISIRKLINDGRIKSYRHGRMDVEIALADESTFALKGYVDWVDNVLDAGTGTLKTRVVINQPRDRSGEAMVLLSPGMFVRMKMPTSAPHDALLVNEKAIGTDQGEKYVFIVNYKNEIERRNVILGQKQIVTVGQTQYKLQVIEKNPPDKGKDLEASDKVVMSGLQRVRAGTHVEPTQVPMPGGVNVPGLLADQNAQANNGKGTE